MGIKHIKHNFDELDSTSKLYFTKLYAKIAMLVDYVRELRKYDKENMKILDVGCGRGELLKCLQEKKYKKLFGIDIDDRCVELCSSTINGKIHKGSIYDLSTIYPSGYFNLVIVSHVLEHLENPKMAIEHIKKVCNKDIIIVVPNLSNPFVGKLRRNVPYVNSGHICGWDAPHLKTFLEIGCNLNIIRWCVDRAVLPGKVRKLIHFEMVNDLLERVLPNLFPYIFSHSLICLVEKKE